MSEADYETQMSVIPAGGKLITHDNRVVVRGADKPKSLIYDYEEISFSSGKFFGIVMFS